MFENLLRKISDGWYGLKIKLFPPRTKKRKGMTFQTSMTLFAYAVLFLPIIQFFIFYVGGNLSSIWLAFADVSTKKFTLDNFSYVIRETIGTDATIMIALKNTTIYFVVGLLMMPINVIVSCTLYKKVWGYEFFQVIFFMPSMIGSMVWMSAYKSFIAPTGPLCLMLQWSGAVEMAPEFLSDSATATWAIVGAQIWLGVPSSMLIYSGTLARIPQEVIEAGELDGITFFEEIWFLLIPLIWPALSTNILFAFIGFFNSSGNVLLLTGGNYKTTTFGYWFYQQTILNNSYNAPAAMGLILTVITLPFAIVGHKLANQIETVEF